MIEWPLLDGRPSVPVPPHVEELRGSTRFPKEPDTDFAVVWQRAGEEALIEVYDESLTGLGLIMPDVERYGVGAAATIVYHGTVLGGVVRNVTALSDGRYLVGFATCRGKDADA